MPENIKTDSVQQESLQLKQEIDFLSSSAHHKFRRAHTLCYKSIKRCADFFIATTSLILISPILAIVAIAIKCDSRGPVFFRQVRTGKNGKEFNMYKFRSMSADNDVQDASCEDKYTKVGRFLRKTSIDELPQLINIMLGQMSFIGPRPWIPDYYKYMNDAQRARNSVRPGITGLAAAKGRNGLTIFEKIAYDLEYVKNFSLLQDFKVIFLTARQVLSGSDVDAGKSGIHSELANLKRQSTPTKSKPTQKPLVSIVVPVYNSEKFIKETIATVKNQTYKNWELILVNDRSTDNSEQIIKKLAGKSKKIKLINLAKNSGAAKARNRGIKEAKGDYLCFLDADDLWAPNKLETQLAFMQEKDSAFSFTSYEFADESGRGNGKIVHVPAKITYRQALKNTIIWTSTVMFNMNKLTKKQVQMPDVRRGQDTATWWKVLKTIDHADGLGDVLSFYRRSKNTLSSNKLTALKRTWNLYRNVEKLNLIKSSYCFTIYCYNAVMRRV